MRTAVLLSLLAFEAHGAKTVHEELEDMRRWWCETGPEAELHAPAKVCLRFRRHSLPKDSPERVELKKKIEAYKESASNSAPEEVEAMHKGWCSTAAPGAGTRICKHHASINHACNVTAGLMDGHDDADGEKLYMERVHAGCMGDKDEL